MDLTRLNRYEPAALAIGAVVRAALLATALPWTYLNWFLPFLSHVVHARFFDIWSTFLSGGGNSAAFPYGPLYIAAFAPLAGIGQFIAGIKGAQLGLGLTVLALDVLLLLLLRRLVDPQRRGALSFAYWLSPIVIYVCYWHAQLDILPVAILSASLLLLRGRRFALSGLVLGSAVAAKLSMGVAVPFMWIYATSSRRLRAAAAPLILGTLAGLAVLLPLLLSPGFHRMVLQTPEREKVFRLAVSYGQGLQLYVLPIVFVGLVFAAWQIRRFNYEVLFNLIGVGFFVIFLLTPASPGWAMWVIPFMTVHLTRASAGSWILASAFSFLFVAFYLMTSTGAVLLGSVDLSQPFDFAQSGPLSQLCNLTLSLYLAAGGAFSFLMLRDGVLNNAFYRATRAPLLIGIAGDSGSGKDTLGEALTNLFGKRSVAFVSGDDYHLWDRHKPMWRALTHLNPRANDLRRFNSDVTSLAAGRPIHAPHYDHKVGRMTKPRLISASDVIIASGLHALHTGSLNAVYDLKIFLAMDEDLRRFFKIQRDVLIRGHAPEHVLASIETRLADHDRYIGPQSELADLVLSLAPLDRRDIASPLETATQDVRLRLSAYFASDSDQSRLLRGLIGVGGLRVVECQSAFGSGLEIEGSLSRDDLEACARKIFPGLFDFLALSPRWADGLTGVMQLIVLAQIDQRLASRKD